MSKRRGRLFGPDAVDYQSQYYGKKERTEAQKKAQMENLKKAQEAQRMIRSGEEEALFRKLMQVNAPPVMQGAEAHRRYADFVERIGDKKGKIARTYSSDEVLEAEARTRVTGIKLTKGQFKRFAKYLLQHEDDDSLLQNDENTPF